MGRSASFFLRSIALPFVLVGLAACSVPTVPRTDVAARIVDSDGGPRQGLAVRIGDALTSTDADGRAEALDVETPYALVAARRDTLTLVHAFEGLDDPTPDVMLADPLFEAILPLWGANTSPRTATIAVALPVAPAANQYAVACVESGEATLYGCAAFLPATTIFEIDAHWYGPVSIDAKLHVVYVQTAAGLPTDAYAYYVGEVVDLTDQGTPTVPLTFVEDPADRSVTVTVRPPSALQATSFSLLVRISENLIMPLMLRFPVAPGAATTVAVPDIGTGGIQAVGRAEVDLCLRPVCVSRSVAWRSALMDGDVVDLDLPTPPLIVEPADLATGVGTETPLSISDTMDGVVTWIASDLFNFAHPQLAVTTRDVDTTLPDPSALQVALPLQRRYALFAVVVPNVVSPVDWLAEFAPLTVSELHGGPGTSSDGSLVVTTWRRIETP